jgi:hypothetical protein
MTPFARWSLENDLPTVAEGDAATQSVASQWMDGSREQLPA